MQVQKLDLQPLMDGLPRSALEGEASLQPLRGGEADAGPDLRIAADIRNLLPGPLDQDRLPVERLLADARITPESWRTAAPWAVRQ